MSGKLVGIRRVSATLLQFLLPPRQSLNQFAPATSILSKINGEYSGPAESAATNQYHSRYILLHFVVLGETFEYRRSCPQV